MSPGGLAACSFFIVNLLMILAYYQVSRYLYAKYPRRYNNKIERVKLYLICGAFHICSMYPLICLILGVFGK